MFKNSVFKSSVDTKEWMLNAGIRALKTFCETALSLITVGQAITNLDWASILGVSSASALISILTSLKGIPEVQCKEENTESEE